MKQKGQMVSIFIALSLLWMNGYSWTKTYGGIEADTGYSAQQTKDGGYIVAGVTWSFGAGKADVWLIKTDAEGDTIWTKTYGGRERDGGFSVQQTTDGGYIMTGYTASSGAGLADVWLIKTDGKGDTVWAKTYGGNKDDWGQSVKQTINDDGYIVVGVTCSFGENCDVWLIKTDSLGDTIWARTFGTYLIDACGWEFDLTTDEGCIVTGYSGGWSSWPETDFYLFKTIKDSLLWQKWYGKKDTGDGGLSVRQTMDGGYIVVGFTGTWPDMADVWLIKTDDKGDTIWTRIFGEYSRFRCDVGTSVKQTSDTGYIIAGYTSSFGAGEYDVWLIKTDSLGEKLWDSTYGGNKDEWGYSVQQTTDGGYILAGWTKSFGAGKSDVYLIKTNKDGNTGIEEKPPSPLNSLSLRLDAFQSFEVFYTLPFVSNVSFDIFDATGRRLKSFVLGRKEKRNHKESLPIGELPAGIYFIRLNTDKGTVMQKGILMK